MKKLVGWVLIVCVTLLAACSNESPALAPNDRGTLQASEVEQIVRESGIGEGDTLHEATLDGEDLYVEVTLAPFGKVDPVTMASTFYSTVSEAFLTYSDGWSRFTVHYPELDRTVTMHYVEHEVDALGKRAFPLVRIEEKMNE